MKYQRMCFKRYPAAEKVGNVEAIFTVPGTVIPDLGMPLSMIASRILIFECFFFYWHLVMGHVQEAVPFGRSLGQWEIDLNSGGISNPRRK